MRIHALSYGVLTYIKITEPVRDLFGLTRYIPVKARRYMLHADENHATRCSESVIDTIINRERDR